MPIVGLFGHSEGTLPLDLLLHLNSRIVFGIGVVYPKYPDFYTSYSRCRYYCPRHHMGHFQMYASIYPLKLIPDICSKQLHDVAVGENRPLHRYRVRHYNMTNLKLNMGAILRVHFAHRPSSEPSRWRCRSFSPPIDPFLSPTYNRVPPGYHGARTGGWVDVGPYNGRRR